MCGIFGVISNKTLKSKEICDIRSLMSANNMRGPDDRGIVELSKNLSLGHTRLSIVGHGEVGHQPMFSYDKKYCIVFNGEIYNFKELATEYFSEFRGDYRKSDTRLLVELIAKFGVIEALKKIDGPYSIAVVDTTSNIIFLARDSFGEKPLFYRLKDQSLFFSSTQKILIDSLASEKLSSEGEDFFLKFGFEHPEKEIFFSVKKVQPGSVLQFNANALSNPIINHILTADRKTELHERLDVDKVFDILSESTSRRINADTPQALLLSGGVDSILTLAMLCAFGIKPVCFTLASSESDFEFIEARKAALYFGCKHIFISYQNTQENFKQYLDLQTSPLGDPSGIALSTLSKEVSKEFKCAFSGDGADEIFSGYPRYLLSYTYKYRLLLSLISSPFVLNKKILRFNKILKMNSKESFLEQFFIKSNENNSLDLILDEIVDIPAHMRSIDQSLILPEQLLMKADMYSMNQGLELRSIFLNRKLLNYCNKASPISNFDFLNFNNKKILRKILKEKFSLRVAKGKRGFFANYKVSLLTFSKGLRNQIISNKEFQELMTTNSFKHLNNCINEKTQKNDYAFYSSLSLTNFLYNLANVKHQKSYI